MICPECSSVIIIGTPDKVIKDSYDKLIKYYNHECQRCFAKILIAVTLLENGRPELIQKYKGWLNEGRK